MAVIGGGNTALEDALFLSNLCESVFLIHRRNAFRGEKLFAEAVEKRKNIIFHGETVVKEILGEKSVTAAVIRSLNSGQEELLPVSAVFIAIGLVPDNRIFSALPLDFNGYILAGDDCKTSLAGVFAAGDTRAKAFANSYCGVRRGYRRLPGRKLCEHSRNHSPLILNRQHFLANGFGE